GDELAVRVDFPARDVDAHGRVLVRERLRAHGCGRRGDDGCEPATGHGACGATGVRGKVLPVGRRAQARGDALADGTVHPGWAAGRGLRAAGHGAHRVDVTADAVRGQGDDRLRLRGGRQLGHLVLDRLGDL